jgi:hypothetical protein
VEAIDLRPLSLGEILDRTFSLYRAHFWLFVGIMAIPSAFSIPFNIVFMSAQSGSAFRGRPTASTIASIAVFVVISLVFMWIAYSLAIGAVTYAVSESYLGHAVTVRGSYSKVRNEFWKIVGVFLVAWIRAIGMLLLGGIGFAIIIGLFAAGTGAAARVQAGPVIPIILGILMGIAYLSGICLWVVWCLRYAVSIPALLLERLGVLASLRRSVQLTRGRRWQMLVAIVLCSMVAYVGVIVFQGPFLVALFVAGARNGQIPEWLLFTSSVSGAIGGSVTGSLLMIVLVLCYYDTRIRKEAFDLQFMMSSLDQPVPAAGPGTPSPA